MFKNKVLDTIFILIRRVVYGALYGTHFLPTRKNKIVVLCYHSIGDDSWRYTVSMANLRKQMAYMMKRYKPITLIDVEKYIKGEITITEPSFAVTFDDGYADIMQTKELFSSLNIHPTVFVLGDSFHANKEVMESNRPFLNREQILELKSLGWGVGSHTMTHANLETLSPKEIVYEVIDSKMRLEQELEIPISYIAYPLGNYSQEVLEAFTQAGYSMGLTMDDSYISRATDLKRVPRVGVDGSHSAIEFAATISDAIIFLRSLVKRALKRDVPVESAQGKKKVDVVVTYFWPVVAGTETNILETYSVLSQQGWDITIHSSTDTLLEKNVLPLSEVYRGLWIRRYVFGLFGFWPRIKWHSTDIIALHNFNVVPFYFILLYTLFLKLIGKKRFTLILVPHGGFVLYTSHFSFVKRIAIQLFYYGIGVGLINATVDGVRAVSQWEYDAMCKKGIRPDSMQVIPNGTEVEAYEDHDTTASESIKASVSRYGKYIVQMGRIEPVKNYETVIRSLKKIPSDVNYIIVGPVQNMAYKRFLDRLIESEGLTDRVIFAGIVCGADKYYLLKHALMMVHMSLWESYCNAVHEGLSQGLVCVVSNVTALPELVRDGSRGFCIDPYDFKTLAHRINALLRHQTSKELISITGRNSKGVRCRSWSDVALDYAQMVVAV